MDDILRVIAGFELLVLTIGFWAFILLFHVLSDWKSTTMGRHFMSLMMCCGVVLTWTWVVLALHLSMTVRLVVALILYGVLAFVVWRQVRLLIKMQIISRDDQAKKVSTQQSTEDSDAESTP